MKVLFISGDEIAARCQWEMSKLETDFQFYHLVATNDIPKLFADIGEIDPDVIVINPNTGCPDFSGVDVVRYLQGHGTKAILLENTQRDEECFYHQRVYTSYNAKGKPDVLSLIIRFLEKIQSHQ